MRVTWPSTIPLLIHQVSPALTASLSLSIPAAKEQSSGMLLWFSLPQPHIEIHPSTLVEQLGELLDQLICLIHLSVQ
jgi:hypothetical protein